MSYSFTLGLTVPTLGHSVRPLVLGDHAETTSARSDRPKALVASGDYFVTLASQIDELSVRASGDQEMSSALQEIVSDLIRLQASYHITDRTG